jgi:hypothetical protein
LTLNVTVLTRDSDGAPEAMIRECEVRPGYLIPAELRTLLLESNGVEGEYGLGLIWPVERIAADNLGLPRRRGPGPHQMRLTRYFSSPTPGTAISSRSLLALTDRTCSGGTTRNDSRTWVAPTIATYLEWWLTARLEL